jgi:hypothetical protein
MWDMAPQLPNPEIGVGTVLVIGEVFIWRDLYGMSA